MTPTEHQESLDPQNWNEMRALAHRMVDDAITYLQTVGERPAWQPVPDDVAARFAAPALVGSRIHARRAFGARLTFTMGESRMDPV